jgi:hypothetical protein
VFWLAVAGLWLIGCMPSAGSKTAAPNGTPATIQAPTAPVLSPTPLPTAKSQPVKAVLVAPDGTEAQPVQAELSKLTTAAGLSLETRPDLRKEDLSPEVKIVVLLSPPANLAELLASAPQTQFIVVAPTGLQPAANLTVIRQKLENQAFVSGYLAALLSTDYRAGGLLPTDGPLAETLQDAFSNGARFYCGVCAPGWPLNQYYPQVAALPAASDGPAWQAALAALYDTQNVDVVYVSAEASRQEVFDYLQGKTQFDKPVLVVGAQIPPDGLKSQWAATVRYDLPAALQQIWPDASAGKGGAVIEAPLVVDNPGPSVEGRVRLVTDVIDQLKAGTIYPLSISQQ